MNHLLTRLAVGVLLGSPCWICGCSGTTDNSDKNDARNDENLHDLPSDLEVPQVVDGPAQAGSRFWVRLPEYHDDELAHAVYLPRDWERGKSYPVIFEYPGNGGFRNQLGDRSDGRVEDCVMGFGLSGGEGYIWVSLPFVNPQTNEHSLRWWGDPDATARYCVSAVEQICEEYGGDRDKLILAGFSRGAIACNFIGLRNDEVAELWCGLFAHSHYDGVYRWGYAESDPPSAHKRLARLNGRPQWISHEQSVEDVSLYLKNSGVDVNSEPIVFPFPNHSADWALKDIPFRDEARKWLNAIVSE